jgi:DNA polymerase (family 10)
MRNRQISTHPNDGIGTYIEKKVLGWLEHPPTISEIPPIRTEFLTLPQARSALQKRPKWSEDLRGDPQMHSTWSDGSGAIPEIAAAAEERGYEYAAITDHSPSYREGCRSAHFSRYR